MNYLTPKEKAEKLIDKMYSISGHSRFSKGYALTAVNEILDFMELEDKDSDSCHNANSKWTDYWLNVKREIEAF